MSLLVILYVWQNIEIVKIEHEYDALAARRGGSSKTTTGSVYEIERYREMDLIDETPGRAAAARCSPATSRSWR